MLKLPQSGRDWLIAIISATIAFFVGGTVVAGTQALLRRWI